MQISEFIKAVHADKEMRLNVNKETGNVFVEWKGIKTVIEPEAIQAHTWDELEAYIHGEDTNPLRHMTRVCGYFSFVSSWNKSKLGELEDRHNGNYALPNES